MYVKANTGVDANANSLSQSQHLKPMPSPDVNADHFSSLAH
jgi:hypothetical protein